MCKCGHARGFHKDEVVIMNNKNKEKTHPALFWGASVSIS
jgi:hypothetical protein